MDAFSVGARYDFNLQGMPVIGDLPLFVAYRGTFRDGCGSNSRRIVEPSFDSIPGLGDLNDHTIMIGTSYSFSGGLIDVDRRGATLDTPDFNYNCRGPITYSFPDSE